ncbi:MAG: hypothetical protein HC809_13695 [Gammaproteobacteria bacterium]|nr:hypothetical protein [Gammaproteobacteria bacterium]
MPSICFLSATHGRAHNDNPQRLSAAFAERGWSVTMADHQAVALAAGRVVLTSEDRPLDDFDLVWLFGLGERGSFLDRMQILMALSPDRFVVTPACLMQLHAKFALPTGPLAHHHPETHASHDPARLRRIVERGGVWIAKPTAGSYGRNVFKVQREDPNLDVILESLTGHDGSSYCLLQRYVSEIEAGEKRVLVANGRSIGCYLRLPHRDHRANLAGDGEAVVTTLSAAEASLVNRCATWLAAQGAGFAAVDIAYPWIVEFNVANPGGLQTIERLTGQNYATAAADALIARFNAGRRRACLDDQRLHALERILAFIQCADVPADDVVAIGSIGLPEQRQRFLQPLDFAFEQHDDIVERAVQHHLILASIHLHIPRATPIG